MNNAREIISVVFKVKRNMNITHYQNEYGHMHTRIFDDIEKAKEFAKGVDLIHAFNGVGEYVKL